jgi:hypothetical protein
VIAILLNKAKLALLQKRVRLLDLVLKSGVDIAQWPEDRFEHSF